ncbi:MAG: hypothetical protein ABSD12_05130 [Paraburkholderia sp.]
MPLHYDLVLPGHGVPGGGELYDEMIAYLDFGEEALASSTSAVEFRQKILYRFANYGDVTARMSEMGCDQRR